MTPQLSRRQILEIDALGFGSLAFACLNHQSAQASRRLPRDLSPKPGHFRAPAKAMIMMMQNGGPGQMDLFDPKPELTKYNGKVHSEKVEMFQPGSEQNKLLASPLKLATNRSKNLSASPTFTQRCCINLGSTTQNSRIAITATTKP